MGNFQTTSKIIPEINVRINEVKYQECVVTIRGEKKPCLNIDMGIENNRKESVVLELVGLGGATIVTKDGKQIEKIGGNDPPGSILSSFRLFPNAQVNFTRSFPIVYKKDNPILYIRLIEYQSEEIFDRKEYNFNLTSYLNN